MAHGTKITKTLWDAITIEAITGAFNTTGILKFVLIKLCFKNIDNWIIFLTYKKADNGYEEEGSDDMWADVQVVAANIHILGQDKILKYCPHTYPTQGQLTPRYQEQ